MRKIVIIALLGFIFGCGGQNSPDLGSAGDTTPANNQSNDSGNNNQISTDPTEPPASPPVSDPEPSLKNVKYFMYQIQGVWRPGAVAALADTHYDLLVIEPTVTVAGEDEQLFDLKAAVATLKTSVASSFKNKMVFAYVDIGEAESYRTYWGSDWKEPVADGSECGEVGTPDFIVHADPDGWAENYPVAFWDPRWLEIMKGVFKTIAESGVDGAYLDWVEAYQDPCVVSRAALDGILDPAEAMISFIKTLKDYARTINPNFQMIGQNTLELGEEKPELLTLIEGLGVENVYFDGEADAEWDDTTYKVGDIKQDSDDTEYFLDIIKNVYLAANIPVFSIDYAIIPENVDFIYENALKEGMVPLVTQVSLAGITTTPPPGY